MKNTNRFLIIVAVIGVSALAYAGDNGPIGAPAASNQGIVKGAANPFSLLSSSRIRWSNSYSVSFFSGAGRSGSIGLLNTSMLYELSPKLSLGLNVGVLHNPGMLIGDRKNSATILPGFRLDYHPSQAFRMIVDVRSVTGALSPYDRASGFWYDPIFPYDWSLQERK